MSASRKEVRVITDHRQHPNVQFATWTRTYLPPNVLLTDVDLFCRMVDLVEGDVNNILLCELKTFGSRIKRKPVQYISMQIINELCKLGNGKKLPVEFNGGWFDVKVKYWGFYELVFEKEQLDFESGFKINGIPSNEKDLINLLTFQYKKPNDTQSDK